MSWRNTLLLAFLVAAVAGIAYRDIVAEDPRAGWEAVFDEPLPTPPAADIERLLDFDPKSVVAVSLESKGIAAHSRRTAYGWTGTSTPRKINDFLDNLRDLAIILAIEEEPSAEELEGFGLAPPRARIRLERADGSTVDIALGQHNPSATGVYARVSQRPGVALTGAVAVWDIGEVFDALDAARPATD